MTASLAVVALFLGSLGAAARAESAVSGRAVMGAGKRAPLMTQKKPPALTLEQQRLRDEAMKHSNLPGPPLRVEPSARVSVPKVPATQGQRPSLPLQSSQHTTPGDAGTFTFFRTSIQAPYSTGTSPTDEPHGGTAGSIVFTTGNWFASYSTDGGATFTFVNPYTNFPALDAGFCCDQTVIYDRTRDLMIWQLQYIYSPTTTRGSERTAFAANASSGLGWCYYDWNPGSFGLTSAALWLDYPHVALSNGFVWYTANVYLRNADGSDSWQDTVIWRIPLDPVTTCSGFTFNYFVVNDHFNFTPTQGASTTMYWGSHNSTSSIRIYRWAENSGTIFWDDVTISTWPRNLPYQCAGPDGLNWCGRGPNDGRIETGWVAGGVIGFMWNASQNSPSRPYPYIHVARFNESDRTKIDEPIIWNGSYAWQYPAIGVNDRGHIAGSAYWGGGSTYPTMVALIADDYSSGPPPWENYGVTTSFQGGDNSWGDWYAARRHGTAGNTWITTGERRLSTGDVQTWYTWFGRERDTPPSLSVTPSSAIAASGDKGGPFSPSSFNYTLSATTVFGSVQYAISGVPGWLTASSTSGTVSSSGATVSFTINSSANSLPPGTYISSIHFDNKTNGLGNTTRTATLIVTRPPSVLKVKPATLVSFSGPAGGPFDPKHFDYTLKTDHGKVRWRVTGVPEWLTVDPDHDRVDRAGEDVRVRPNAKATRLSRGTYTATLHFVNMTNAGQPEVLRDVKLRVTRPSSPELSESGRNSSSSPLP
jgi:hypothetical protein